MKKLERQDNKPALLAQLFSELRAEQDAVQLFDETAAELMGINLTDLRCLGILERLGRLPASELARESGLTTGSVTTMIDRLERSGYVRRERDERDRRRVFVALTEHASEAIERIWGPLGREGMKHAGRHSAAELELIIGYLRSSRALLDKHIARLRTSLAAEG